jgi:hypothetical protein
MTLVILLYFPFSIFFFPFQSLLVGLLTNKAPLVKTPTESKITSIISYFYLSSLELLILWAIELCSSGIKPDATIVFRYQLPATCYLLFFTI